LPIRFFGKREGLQPGLDPAIIRTGLIDRGGIQLRLAAIRLSNAGEIERIIPQQHFVPVQGQIDFVRVAIQTDAAGIIDLGTCPRSVPQWVFRFGSRELAARRTRRDCLMELCCC